MPELICAADDPRWLEERRAGVTATDITAITGLSPYESEYSLYWKKLGHIPDMHEDNDRLRLGRDLEPIILNRWGEEVYQAEWGHSFTNPGLCRNDTRSWQMATPDMVIGETWRSLTAAVEVKSWADADRHAWTDAPPPRVRAQVLWQMDTLDVATGHVGVLFLPSGEFRSYVIEHDGAWQDGWDCAEGNCQRCDDIRLMRAAGEEFMARIRHELPPPSPDASSATLAALKARFTSPAKAKEAEIDGKTFELWLDAKAVAALSDTRIREAEVIMREQSGDAGILTVNGTPVARHTVSVIKGHWRKESKRDSITRIKNGETDA